MSEKRGMFFSILSLALITFLGNGFLWEYKKIGVDTERLSIEKGKNELEKEKLDLDRLRVRQEKETSEIALQKQRTEQGLFFLEKDKHRIELERLEMEKQRNILEFEKHSMEKIKEAMALREKKNELLVKIIELSDEYIKMTQSRGILERIIDKKDEITEINKKVRMLMVRLDSYKNEFKNIEYSLAKIENRDPETINLNFFPPEPPRSLRIIGD